MKKIKEHRPDEIEILKAVSAKLDEETLFVMTYQYHTERDPDSPEGRNDRSKSRYRMLGRVERIADLEARMADLRTDAKRMDAWRWPDDPTWPGRILYMYGSSNSDRSNWIRLKLKKALPWDKAARVMAGYKKDVRPRSPTFGEYVVHAPGSAYDVKDYVCSDGSVIDLTDRETLLSKVGQNVWKEIAMKTRKGA